MVLEFPRPWLIGMIHLPALPGSPTHQSPMTDIIDGALRDASILCKAGFDALMIENYGDVPFHADSIEPAATAALAIVADRVKRETHLPLGVNALRNDAHSAMGIAAAAGAQFIRVNVHTGVAATDQGILQGRAAHTLRYRRQLGADVAILADVHVKHAVPMGEKNIAIAAEDAAYRGLAEALIVSGPSTGQPCDLDDVRRVKTAVSDRPILVGSGASSDTIREILAACDGAIVGTSLKVDGVTRAPVDAQRARAFIEAARG